MAEIVKVVTRVRDSEIRREYGSIEGQMGRYLRKRGDLIVIAARRQVGKHTGRLAASIHLRITRATYGLEMKIGSDVRYALEHHDGTRPHLIHGRTGPLRFTAGGRVIYTHAVMHPGTRPNRYLKDNLHLVKV